MQIRWVRVLVITIMKDKHRFWRLIVSMENTISLRYAHAIEDHLSALIGIKTYSINSLVFPGTAENRSRAVSATYPLEDLEDASARAAATVKPSDVCPKWATSGGIWWLRSGSGSAAVWSRADQAGCPTICTNGLYELNLDAKVDPNHPLLPAGRGVLVQPHVVLRLRGEGHRPYKLPPQVSGARCGEGRSLGEQDDVLGNGVSPALASELVQRAYESAFGKRPKVLRACRY